MAALAERFLDSILENMPNMVFVKEAGELRFLRLNRAGEELLGIPREEIIGKNDHDLFAPHEADHFVADDRAVLAAGGIVDIPEETIKTPNNGTRILHTRKIAIRDEEASRATCSTSRGSSRGRWRCRSSPFTSAACSPTRCRSSARSPTRCA